MQQHADICPVLLMEIHNVLSSCKHGGHKRIRSAKHKLTKADLQPIELEQSDRIYCNCGTPSSARSSQGGLQPLNPTCLTRTEDISQRIDSLQHYVESILASDCEFIESTNSEYDTIELHCNKIFPGAFLVMEKTTKVHEDANSQIFNSISEGVLLNYDLSQRVNRLEQSIKSLLASKRDVIQINGSRFGRLENFYRRVFPDAFFTMEKTIEENKGAGSMILEYTLEDFLPDFDLFQRFDRLQHTVDHLEAYAGNVLVSIASRSRMLRKIIYPYAVLAVEQIKKARGCNQQDVQ